MSATLTITTATDLLTNTVKYALINTDHIVKVTPPTTATGDFKVVILLKPQGMTNVKSAFNEVNRPVKRSIRKMLHDFPFPNEVVLNCQLWSQ